MPDRIADIAAVLCSDLGLQARELATTGSGELPSCFAVTDLAVASIGVAGQALAALAATVDGGGASEVSVDRALASQWFGTTIEAMGWEIPPPWDPLAGDYAGADGWIRLHTNAPRHRAAALAALGVAADRDAVATAVAGWQVGDLETAVVAVGGAAAAMRTQEDWATHPQGVAVARESLAEHQWTSPAATSRRAIDPARPLAGLRVLDMTRVLAGPVATRLLAGWGADVLRVDAPDWDEPAVAAEVTLGKHCTRLDLTRADDHRRWEELLAEADLLVHGYRPGALDAVGLTADQRDDRRPGLIEVSLDAYGWSGPYAGRRGFDSLVQMSTGIAAAGQAATGADRPVPLPVQGLDHATGYIMAAAAICGVLHRQTDGVGSRWRSSLARTAKLLTDQGLVERVDEPLQPGPQAPGFTVEETRWGTAHRLPPPVTVAGAPLTWRLPARPLGSDPAAWAS